jgi:hypothetical protein
VLAHELSHVRNRDTLISAIAATLAGVILMVARMAQFAAMFGGMRRDDREGASGLELLVMIVVAPLAAMLIQMAVSRSREFQADATGAQISHSPHDLASASRRSPWRPDACRSRPARRPRICGSSTPSWQLDRKPVQHASAGRGAHSAAAGHGLLSAGSVSGRGWRTALDQSLSQESRGRGQGRPTRVHGKGPASFLRVG